MIRAFPIRLMFIAIVGIVVTSLAASATAAQSTGCTLDPVPLPLFGATPAVEVATPEPVLAVVPELDHDGAVEAVESLLACAGEDSQDLRYAIFTDRYLANLFIGEHPADQPAFERMIAVGAVTEPSTPELIGVSDVETLDDGRVAATVDAKTAEGAIHDRLILAWDPEQEAWLIDDVISLNPPVATPTA